MPGSAATGTSAMVAVRGVSRMRGAICTRGRITGTTSGGAVARSTGTIGTTVMSATRSARGGGAGMVIGASSMASARTFKASVLLMPRMRLTSRRSAPCRGEEEYVCCNTMAHLRTAATGKSPSGCERAAAGRGCVEPCVPLARDP